MKRNVQTSESIKLGVILALSGGLMDAYSYIERGGVFANAQTGNLLLLGVNLAEGRWSHVVQYLLPVLAFAVGIALAETARIRVGRRLHWRQFSVLTEAMILFCVAFLPQNMNLFANSLTSLACGIQVESFRKIHGHGVATTMCIGNLRSGTENLCAYFHTKEREHLKRSVLYYGIISFFVLGAILGNGLIHVWEEKAILGSAVILAFAFLLMFRNGEGRKEPWQGLKQ